MGSHKCGSVAIARAVEIFEFAMVLCHSNRWNGASTGAFFIPKCPADVMIPLTSRETADLLRHP